MRDILLTDSGDIDLTGGDLSAAYTERATGQHKRDILLAAPGDFHQAPTLGVDAAGYVQDDAGLFQRDERRNMEVDGITVTRVAFDNNGNLVIDGGYKHD